MNPVTSRLNGRGAARLAALFGSASFIAMASGSAQAQLVAQAPIEEVLITGSLISGAPAVGIPVTALGAEDFMEVGALNVLELLETLPGLTIPPTNSPAFGAGTLHYANNVQIHGLGVGDTLMMVDGKRWPLMGYDGERVDPAIIPQIAIDRVDILTSGASATYGADATAGVINIILKRGYDGAQSYIRGGYAPNAGNESVTVAQIFGTTWDTGNLTASFEFQRVNKVEASDLFWYTWNFSDGGFEGFDFTQIAASAQGFVTIRGGTGNSRGRVEQAAGVLTPSGRGVHGCSNCFSVPHGIGWEFGSQAPGPTTSYAALQARPGVLAENMRNPWHDGWARPEMESTAGVVTFSQQVLSNFEAFGVDLGPVTLNIDANFSNRRFKQRYPVDQGQVREHMTRIGRGLEIPRSNPYFPTGVPDDERLFVHFSLGPESEDIVSGGMTNGRWLAGFEFNELPGDWRGNIFYSQTDNFSYGYDRGGMNRGNVAAAMGLEVEIDPADFKLDRGQGDVIFTKPSGLPYLNPFCDSLVIERCNSQATLDFMTGFRDQFLRSHFTEFAGQIDGPIFDLPAGPVMMAIALNRSNRAQRFNQVDTTNTEITSQIAITGDSLYEVNDAAIFQVNVPVFGGNSSFPFFEGLDLEFGLRYDAYDTLAEAVWTPKYAVNWLIGSGLTLRASFGTSFRTPKGEEISKSGADVQARNISGSIESVNSTVLDCITRLGPDGVIGVAAPGSLTELLNPTCNTVDPTLFAPTILDLTGPPVLAAPILQASGLLGDISLDLGPQNAKQWNLGFNFTPGPGDLGGFFTGLSVDATYWNLDYFDLIDSIFRGRGPNDPRSRGFFIPIPDPDAAITDPVNASFLALANELNSLQTRRNRKADDFGIETLHAIQISFNGNLGRAIQSGIDFSARYDWEMGNLGFFNLGLRGFYETVNKDKGAAEDVWEDFYRFETGGPTASGNRLKRVRYRAGWTDGTWTINSFFNYYGHTQQDDNGIIILPRCFYGAEFSGVGSCYPGSPYYGPFTGEFPLSAPANVLVDLQIGYNTGLSFSNAYLHNINLSLSITNLLDKTPPLGVHPLRSRGTGVVAYDNVYPDLTREVSFTITKLW